MRKGGCVTHRVWLEQQQATTVFRKMVPACRAWWATSYQTSHGSIECLLGGGILRALLTELQTITKSGVDDVGSHACLGVSALPACLLPQPNDTMRLSVQQQQVFQARTGHCSAEEIDGYDPQPHCDVPAMPRSGVQVCATTRARLRQAGSAAGGMPRWGSATKIHWCPTQGRRVHGVVFLNRNGFATDPRSIRCAGAPGA